MPALFWLHSDRDATLGLHRQTSALLTEQQSQFRIGNNPASMSCTSHPICCQGAQALRDHPTGYVSREGKEGGGEIGAAGRERHIQAFEQA